MGAINCEVEDGESELNMDDVDSYESFDSPSDIKKKEETTRDLKQQ
jgi:hypothetical protein